MASTPQTIAVMGIDDFVAGSNQPYIIATNPADASCTNQDND